MELGPAGADDEEANAAPGLHLAVDVHRREALVMMIVTGERQRHPSLVKHAEQRRQPRRGAVKAGAVDRVVEEGELAARRAAAQILGEPASLRRVLGACEIAVQRDEVPGTEIEAVIAGRRARAGTPPGVVRPAVLAGIIAIA